MRLPLEPLRQCGRPPPVADIRPWRHIGLMRAVIATFLAVVAAGCSDPAPAPKVDRVELRISGWSALDVEVNSRGEGRYRLGEPFPKGRGASFALPPDRFTALVERLEPFQRQAVPVTATSVEAFISRTCPEGVPFATDAGGVWIRWIGPGFDRHYGADLGCDPERNAARNEELLGLVRSLPVPLD